MSLVSATGICQPEPLGTQSVPSGSVRSSCVE